MTSKIQYIGGLQTAAEHVKSKSTIGTDAPVDNNGKGSTFSPTDLVASALASCMLTVMGIKAQSMGFDLEDASAEVTKVMSSAPRRISEIQISFKLKKNCSDRDIVILEKTARTCPVARSLSLDLNQQIDFKWI